MHGCLEMKWGYLKKRHPCLRESMSVHAHHHLLIVHEVIASDGIVLFRPCIFVSNVKTDSIFDIEIRRTTLVRHLTRYKTSPRRIKNPFFAGTPA